MTAFAATSTYSQRLVRALAVAADPAEMREISHILVEQGSDALQPLVTFHRARYAVGPRLDRGFAEHSWRRSDTDIRDRTRYESSRDAIVALMHSLPGGSLARRDREDEIHLQHETGMFHQAIAALRRRVPLDHQGMACLCLSGASLAGSNLSYAFMPLCDLRDSDLEGARLAGTTLTGSDLRGAKMRRAVVSDSDLGHVSLDGTDLVGARFLRVDLHGAGLRRAHVEGAHFTEVELAGADTAATDLRLVS